MKPIELERIDSSPETRLCTEHAEKIKKHGGEFVRSVSHEKTSKAGSIKQNYGGVNTSKERNLAAIERLKDEYEAEKWEENKG
jgi:hypothetical protein